MTEEEKMELDIAYKTIVSNIVSEEGQCVLILGPELSVNSSGEGFRSYYRDLKKNTAMGIEHFFESENLFAFKDDAGLRSTKMAVKEFYEDAGDPVLLDMIARIKFPLIINLCPDIALYNLYKEKGITCKKAFLSEVAQSKFKDTPTPTKEVPVIYNIFGSVENDNSLILDHSKLYETIEYLLTDKSLPENIGSFLNLANSFILLGVRFDSWYYQLICHKLKLKQRTNVGTVNKDESVSVSMVGRKNFSLLFTSENPVQTIERITAACRENPDALRKKDLRGKYSLFLSYAWADAPPKNADGTQEQKKMGQVTRETPVNYLSNWSKLKAEPLLQIFRDHKDLDYGDNIESFMTRIGKGKTVVRVISDKYLRSMYCMIEAMLMSKYNDGEKRIYTVIWEDADLDNEQKYRDYWEKKCEEAIKNIENDRYDNYVKIYRFIIPFLNTLKNEVRLDVTASDFDINVNTDEVTLKPPANERMEDFINTIINKMKAE
jgi:hypothetical protein